jgi:hypothetical protein
MGIIKWIKRNNESIINGIIIILSFVVVGFISVTLGKKTRKELDKHKEYVGEEVIIKNDTLIITKFSRIKNCYITHKGTELSYDLVRKLKEND